MELKSLISPEEWPEFCEWARDGGYDQSYFNRWDSKSRGLEEQYLEEKREWELEEKRECLSQQPQA